MQDRTQRSNERPQPDPTWRLDNYVVWRRTTPFSPPTDIIELPDKLVVLLEIAGMRAGDFKVVLLDNRVIITGTREHSGWQNAAYHQVEIGYGDFRVEVLLPWSVEREDVSASYRDGFLQIDLPRKPEMSIRVVDVQADDTHQQE